METRQAWRDTGTPLTGAAIPGAGSRHILAQGNYRTLRAERNLLVLERFAEQEGEALLLFVNRSERPQSIVPLNLDLSGAALVLGEALGAVTVLRPYGCSVLKINRKIQKRP